MLLTPSGEIAVKKLTAQTYIRARVNKLTTFGASLLLSMCTMQSALAQVNIAQIPLFLKTSVDSNLVFIFDDSGSMGWEYMPDSIGGDLVLFPGGPHNWSGGTLRVGNFWYYSSRVNAIYYDPDTEYALPHKPDGSGRFPNSNFNAAWKNGFSETGSVNLSIRFPTHRFTFEDSAFYYRFNSSPGCEAAPKNNNCYDLVFLADENTEQQQNFANWYSFYSLRDLASKSGITEAFFDLPENIRLGYGAININNRTIDGVGNTNTLVSGVRPYNAAHRQQFLTWLQNKSVSGGTPLRTALKDVGNYYSRTDSRGPWGATPGTSDNTADIECRQSFSLIMTDSIWNGSTPGDVLEADAVAAIASGEMINWPQPGSDRNPQNIDDLLHAAINGRGGYASAQNPKEFTAEIQGFLGGVIARAQTSASAAAVSSAVLRTDALGFFAGFRSEDWSGTLTGFNFNLGTEIWDAETVLENTLPADRTLITYNRSAGVKLAFTSATSLSNLSQAQQDALNADPTLAASQDNLGPNRLAWLHGDNSAHSTFRDRQRQDAGGATVTRLLGDVINANPQFVGTTNYGFRRLSGTEGSSYGAFRSTTTYRERTAALYVPANDGILHAFDSETGGELFGYIPSELLLPTGSNSYARISELMNPSYTHKYLMDGTPRIQDAYFDKDGDGSKEWRTVLLGTMGNGGKTVFALDITEPDSFSPSDDVLWEFQHTNLGYGVTDPQIARLDSGKWVAIFGNGYNGGSNQSSLFVVDLESGALLKELQTGVGSAASPNGFASATITSFPESDAVMRYAYGGDLLGNLWRFNITGQVSAWSTTKIFSAISPAGNTQPITVAPRAALNPNNNDELVIAFGTGSFLRSGDEGDYDIQSLYVIKDDLSTSTLLRTNLLAQTIVEQTNVVIDRALDDGTNSFTVRDTSANTLTDEKGWYLDLVYNASQEGERVISRATFPFGVNPDRVRFTTVIPDSDPCGSGRTGFIMDLKLTSGAPSDTPVFDLNSDGIFNTADITGGFAASGIQVGYGGENRTIATQSGEAEVVIPGTDPRQLSAENPCEDGPCVRSLNSNTGRQTWEQLR
ncbi:type IV pilus assembly protein PilY1 [Marinobacter sp. LV10R520-4]|nr:type IV pilus assembly protein PilY1 [Marinobacter sp. LV10R520-4]